MTGEQREHSLGGVRCAQRRVQAGAVEVLIMESPDAEPARPALLLLPGMLDLWSDYAAVLPALSARFHVIAMDHRGHGGSAWAQDGRYRVVDYADDVIALIENELRSPVAISGNSLGGLIGLNVAARRPDLVHALALEDAPLLITEPAAWPSHWFYPFFEAIGSTLVTWRAQNGDIADLATRIAALDLYRPPIQRKWSDRFVAAGKALEGLRETGWLAGENADHIHHGWLGYVSGQRPRLGECLPAAIIEAMARTWATVDPRVPMHATDLSLNEGFDHIRALQSVRCPVLLWEADADLSGLVPTATLEFVKESLQHVPHWHRRLGGAGHHLHCDAPGPFAAYTIEHLSTQSSSS